MKCPTCEYEMDAIGADLNWCPRCGTLASSRVADLGAFGVPLLVGRCRRFVRWPGMSRHPEWKRAGIPECINKPGDRK